MSSRSPAASTIDQRIPLWIDLREVPVNKRLPHFKAASEAGVDTVLLARDDPHLEREGFRSVRLDGNMSLKEGTTTEAIGRFVRLRSGKDQDRAAAVEGVVIVDGGDWTIIPLENLIAARRDRPDTLFGLARSPKEALLFRDTLEVGVHGIVLAPGSPGEITEADRLLRERGRPHVVRVSATPTAGTESEDAATGADAEADAAPQENAFLVPAKVTAIIDAGPGDRVCVDTTSVFRPGEGLLIGSTARGFTLVHAETIETEYVRARPFRVNAGAVHSYLFSAGSKTHYLSELGAGKQVLAVHPDGIHRVLTVGRAKIERRPHTIIQWRTDAGDEGNVVLQTAETIRVVRPDGSPLAVTELAEGDEILVHTESAARHFGMPVDESLTEV